MTPARPRASTVSPVRSSTTWSKASRRASRRSSSSSASAYRAALKGTSLELSLGYSHPVIIEAPEGISFEVPSQTEIIVHGASKEQVGQIAADIRKWRKPEPYKGKGIRYEGEVVRRKLGKAAKSD